MKIKVFKSNSVERIENSVNEFIKDKKVIRILQSECYRQENKEWSLTFTVLYDDIIKSDAFVFEGLDDMDDDINIEIIGADNY
ncbi:MAG: hypothetical protein N2489_07750 [Clostridia bacterium]|nr:hypothetical protein [Clostridia bacterium]